MKYFTPLVRSLVLAFGLFALSGSAKAQLSCGLNPNNIEITVQSTCDATNPSILFNFGSFFVNGPVTVEFKTFYFNGFFSFPQNSVIEVNAVNGFAIGEFPPNAPPVVATNNFVRLINISIENTCFQDFTADEVDSNLFDIGTTPSIDPDETTVVVEDAPCDNVPTGQIDIFFLPLDGNTSNPNRFSATRTDFGLVNVYAPGEFPNPSSTEYLARATNLLPGDYTVLVFDVATGCETDFTETIEGEFSLTVSSFPASCFGESDGRLRLEPDGADPNVNGDLFYVIEGPIPAPISGSIAASVSGYPNRNINNLPAGTYQVSISDSNGNCTLTETATIGQPDEITVGFLFAPPICADDNDYTVEVAGLGGLDFNLQNASYRIIDPAGSCWTSSSRMPFPVAANGGYSLMDITPPVGACRPLNQDTMVNLELRLFNNFTGCFETFPFSLQVNAQPVDPMVEVFSILGSEDTVVGPFCSNQDIEINIPNYDPANSYEITYTGSTVPGALDTMGDFNAMSIAYTGDGSVVGSFQNNTNGLRTIEMQVVATNMLTGCASEPTDFSFPVRPLPVVDPIFDLNPIVCSAQDYDLSVFLNDNGTNQNVRYDFQWSFSTPLLGILTLSGTDRENGDVISANFVNQSGEDQTATLTITPTFPQNNQTISGGPGVDNSCTGEPVVVTLTVQPQPSLTADLEIGEDVSTTLMSGDAVAYEICSGDDFLLDNLMIPEPSGAKLKFVIFEVTGDAGFLNIPTPTTQYLPIDNFLIGVQNIMNNDPNNNAQVANITLTPYFEMGNMSANQSSQTDCLGEPIQLVLTVNPLPPALNSPQAATFCSEERVDYVIGGASGMGNLETRISEFNTFEDGATDFIVPEGAARIEDFSFTLSGGNGGGTAGAGPNRTGGRGALVSGNLSTVQLLPGDTVRVRKGAAGATNASNGDGGDATTMVVIRPGSGIVHTFVAAGGGGAGVAENGMLPSTASSTSSPADGDDGQGPGGFGGTGFPDAEGGAGQGNGGGGGGGWIGGDGGNSQSGSAGQGGDSYGSTGSISAVTKPLTQDPEGDVQLFYTVVYDDIRFDLVSKTVDPGLTDQSEPIVDGEVDTILFGQQFMNPTNGPLDVTYVLSTRTEADCTDGSTVEVVLTIEPEATAELASNGTMVMGDPENGYTATICSGDSLSAYLFSMATPTGGDNQLRYTTSFTTSSNDINIVGNDPARASSGIPGASGGNRASQDSVLFFERAIRNRSMVAETVTYTITPIINRPGQPNCPGEPFTFTVTVNPGFFGVANSPGLVDVCSRDVFSDEGFDLKATQPNLNIDFSTVRLVDYRVSTTDPNFTAISAVDTTGLASGGVLLTETNGFFNNDSYRNRTGAGVTVEYDIRLVSDDGCESQVITYSFLVRAEPIIDITNSDFTICTGDEVGLVISPTANSAFAANFNPTDVTFDYELDLPAGLVFVGGSPYPLSGIGRFAANDDILVNDTNSPLVATYTVTATSQFGCTSEVATFNVTVDPKPEINVIATHAGTSIVAEQLQVDIDTLTICSGGQVTFSPSQNVVGTNVLYRVSRNVDNAMDVVDGSNNPIDLFEGGLEFVDMSEVLINNGNTAQYVLYSFAAYTFGPDGLNGDGLNASDDCRGVFKRLRVEVLPSTAGEADLAGNLLVGENNAFSVVPSGTQICDQTEVSVRPRTLIDPNSGAAFVWTRENDGTPLTGPTSGSGEFSTTPNGNGEYVVQFADRINQVLVAEDDQTVEVRYIVSLYTFGTNGVNDFLAEGSDDCLGDVDTITVNLDPTPVLSADLQVGDQMDVLAADGSPYIYEVCSGEDFLINNLMIPELADGKANYVQLTVAGQADFIGVPNGFNVGVFPAASFSIGAQNVQNTSGSNSAQTALLVLTPYFEDGNNDQSFDSEECGGESIEILVTLNPTPPELGPFETTVCSEDRIEYQIPGASNVGGTFRSRVAGSTDFSESNDFVVPPGAFAIRGINISLSGANGGDRIGQNRGGLGGTIDANMNPFLSMTPNTVFPGDTIRVRKGQAGAADLTHGDGGDATMVCVIAGPNSTEPEGSIVETFLAAGGGGAGFAENGLDVTGGSTNPTMPSPSDGMEGAGLGGFGGTGWNAMNPASGSLGGAGRGNGGGGGGGWAGGDGGANLSGSAGQAGTSYAGTVINPVNASFGTKDFSDADDGEVIMTYTLVFNDVRFSLLERSVAAGLIDVSDNPIVDGETDTILFGERFDNPTDGPLDVNYVFTTSSEAECPGGTVEVTITVEPTPTLQLASGRTTITQDGPNEYSATICSRDSLDAVLTSSTMPSEGVNFLRARVIDADFPAGVFPQGGNPARASEPNGRFGGAPNDRPAAAPVPFFETRIINNNDVPADVVYTVVPRIVGGDEVCFGDTLTLTVTVQPGFPGIDLTPAQVNVCSNVSLEDNGFDITGTQSFNNGFMIEQIRILSVTDDAGGDPNFETISSVFSGTPVVVDASVGGFGGDTYRNRTGSPVTVTYEVEFLNSDGCASRPVTYTFRITAEPVIAAMETVSNIIDTIICSTATTGLQVNPAPNSAFFGAFGANVELFYEIDLPMGVELTKSNGSYPAAPASGRRTYFENDELLNTTNAPLDVVYTVTPSNNGCLGDPVQYTVTVNPEPFADVMLTSMDSTATFGLDNADNGLATAPEFGVCSGQALHVSLPGDSLSTPAGGGMTMVNVRVLDGDGITDFNDNVPFTIPLSELADTLSFGENELINLTGSPITYTVRYNVFFEYDGVAGRDESMGDCDIIGTVVFDVTVNPVNTAQVRVDDPNTNSAFPIGMDTLCSGDFFDLVVRAEVNDPTLPVIDSFFVEVMAAGDITAGPNTSGMDFWVTDQNTNSPYGRRIEDLTFFNSSAGIKTVTYIATPYSNNCPGIPDTTSISFIPVVDLELALDGGFLCAPTGVATAVQLQDLNGNMLSTDRTEYRWEYLGGTAANFTIAATSTANPTFISNPAGQAGLVVNNRLEIFLAPQAGLTGETAIFEVIYDDVAGCGEVTDTVTVSFSTDVSAGIPDPTLGVQCDGVNFILFNALLDEDEGGQFFFANGDPIPGAPNYTPMIGGSGTDPVSVDFIYVVGGGNSGCTLDTTEFSVMVEPAPNAGTYVGTPGEACQDAPFFNLFDLIPDATASGTFTQTGGGDFVTVNADGTFDQSTVTPGIYTFSYEVMSAFGCGSDTEGGIAVEVVDRADCSVVVPCDVITLRAGANVISFDVIPSDNSVQSIFADLIASQNLLQVVSVQPGVNNGDPELFVFLSGLGFYAGSITGGIQPGYGYVVTVAQDATVEVCGTPVDEDLRVALQEDLNIVAYVPQAPQSADTYFNTLNQTGQLDFIRTAVGGVVTQRFYAASPFPFPFGNLTQVENGRGYVVNAGAAIGADTWKRNGFRTTANFDHFFGRIDNGKQYVGQTLQFVDVDGNLFGTVTVRNDGLYYGELAYGDVANTDAKEGFYVGEEVFMVLDGETYATGLAFSGNWGMRRFDIDPRAIDTDEIVPATELETTLSVFPNPTFGPVSVEFTTPVNHREAILAVFNGLGQIVFEQKVNGVTAGQHLITFDVNELPAGTYQLILSSEVGLIGRKQFIRK